VRGVAEAGDHLGAALGEINFCNQGFLLKVKLNCG
jgi:hypothetical protein